MVFYLPYLSPPPTFKKLTETQSNKHSTNDTVSRNKRQIFALAALALGSSSTFLGIFNSAEMAAV
jgi:hypothetical protein